MVRAGAALLLIMAKWLAAEGLTMQTESTDERRRPPTRAEELKAFFFITAILAPALAFAAVIGWGFIVWMLQLLTGRLPGAY
jgi:periplasmic nitrate reductase NapE